MKYILLITVLFCSCSKDAFISATETRCAKVYDLKEIYANLYNGHIATDTLWPKKDSATGIRLSPICCDSLFSFWENQPETWVRICYPDGTTKYWERYIVEIKKIR